MALLRVSMMHGGKEKKNCKHGNEEKFVPAFLRTNLDGNKEKKSCRPSSFRVSSSIVCVPLAKFGERATETSRSIVNDGGKSIHHHHFSTIHSNGLDALHRFRRAAHRVQSHLVQGRLDDLGQFALAFPLKSALDPLGDFGVVVGVCSLDRC